MTKLSRSGERIRDLLVTRIARLHGFKRLGRPIRERILD